MDPRPGSPTDDKGPMLMAVMWSLTAVTILIVAARLTIRATIVRSVGLDDWLIVVGMLIGVAYVIVTTLNIAGGYGKHQYTLEPPEIQNAIMLNSVSFIFGILSFAIPKMAVVAMLNRILNPSKTQRIFLWSLVSLAGVVSVVCILVLFTMCHPPRALWDLQLQQQGATCNSPWILINYAIFTGALSAFVDLYLSIYPITVLFKLQMSLRKKLALSAALGLGTIASAMAIIKCTQLKGLADKSDYTYGTAELVVWTNIEADIVVIASCIPTLQPLLERLSRKANRSKNSKGYYNSSNGYMNSSSRGTKRPHLQKRSSLSIANSQESILPTPNGQAANEGGQIRRTDDVVVEYELQGRKTPNGAFPPPR
ncbi:hypothetical protein FQN55_001647 [Onygenales sp. PD_40]|nr:hypothetical protein FQN55_001647 [Onygenales sp. PD_40]